MYIKNLILIQLEIKILIFIITKNILIGKTSLIASKIIDSENIKKLMN